MKKIFVLISICFSLSRLSYGSNEFLNENNDKLLANMTLREKIGQLCIVAAAADEKRDHEVVNAWFRWQPLHHLDAQYVESLIQEHHIGGVIFYGAKVFPQDQLALTKHFQSLSKIPLLITLDAEVGLGSRLDQQHVLRYPNHLTLGAIQEELLIYQAAYQIGQQLKKLGVHVNFAPVVDVNSNPNNPVIGKRSFGSDINHVAECGVAFMQGLQDAGIIACAKHFPGHGDTTVDSHLALPTISHSRESLEAIELFPFTKLFHAGVKSVMTAHLEVPALEKEIGRPSSLSKAIVTDLLQHQMGFNGLIFTDALGMKAVADHFPPGEIELAALQAGNDILLCPVDAIKAIDRIEQAVHRGEITEEEINQKVLKVLNAKKWALQNADNEDTDLQGGVLPEEAKQFIRQLYRKAVTVIKSESGSMITFPLEKTVVINTDDSLIEFEESIKAINYLKLVRQTFQKESFSLINFFKQLWYGSDQAIVDASHLIITISNNFFLGNSSLQVLTDCMNEWKIQGKHVTLVLFCNPHLVPLSIDADQIILAYESVADAQIAAVEVLKGTEKAEGRYDIPTLER
jgi:beta-N-acetylhexosaminidase